MKRRPVIIDCDPGIDDAVALLLALRAPEIEVRGITTVAGNVGLEHTCPNALRILDLAGEQRPVYAGADRPLFGSPVTADDVHGADGLLGLPLPPAERGPEAEKAWDAIYREAQTWGGSLELVALGPLTNLAIAMAKYPELPKLLRRVVVMGGGAEFGNATPAAEFNVFADPEAAELVLRSGVPMELCGLDVTHQAYLTREDISAVRALDTPQARFSAEVIGSALEWHQRFGIPGSPMHDPCALVYALNRSLFTSVRCWVGVERSGKLTRGKTVTDAFSDAKRKPNAVLVTGVERDAFVSRVIQLLESYKAK